MIEELALRDLGVIRSATLSLHPGFTVITGETGAGKTMLLTGIDLIRGGRPDPARVRPGADRADVEAVLVVGEGSAAADAIADILEQADASTDDGALIVARSVPVEGRARARLGGRSVPSSTLAELSGHLIAVHGQGEQQRLARSDVQRAILDRVAGESAARSLSEYRSLLERIRVIDAAIADARTHGAERESEARQLRELLDHMSTLSPVAGEFEALAAEAERLSHAEALRAAAEAAHEALSAEVSDNDALTQVATARRALDAERQHDAALGELADRLGNVTAALLDVSADIAAYAASVDGDPARLEAVQVRRAELTAFERRHGRSAESFINELPHLSERLLLLDGGEERVAELTAEGAALRSAIAPVALDLHEARVRAAQRLSDLVAAELAALAMPQARVEWVVSLIAADADSVALPDGRLTGLGPWGVDDVELLLASHRDAPPLPLARAASGGELSRVMLALEVVLAGDDPVPTMVFDEVDAGVGGRAAVEVGRRLARLARTTQVVVVTHLAQVAAFADRHVVVTRRGDDEVTTSDVDEVVGDDRVRELARMLAGLDDSTSAADHARELLDLAEAERRLT